MQENLIILSLCRSQSYSTRGGVDRGGRAGFGGRGQGGRGFRGGRGGRGFRGGFDFRGGRGRPYHHGAADPAHRPSDFSKAERLSVAKTVLGLQVLCDSRQILMCYRGECKVVIGYEREFESVINIA